MGTTDSENRAFNLIDEPWILCRTKDGPALLSLTEIFDGTAAPLRIVGDSPTQDYAVLRVLLAIFWRAHQLELASTLRGRRAREAFSWPAWFRDTLAHARDTGRDEVVLAYLDAHHERFDLLHAETPFMQVADLHTEKGHYSEISRIVPEAEQEYFTMRTGEGRTKLGLAEAARWLVHVHAYDYAGIKSGAVGDPRVKGGRGYPIGTGWTGMTGGTVVRGTTLLETLVLNSTDDALSPDNVDDLPVWERRPGTAAQRTEADPQPTGAIDLATWQSRRVRLIADGDEVTGVLVSNGDKIPNAGKNVFGDPMTPYRFSPNQSKKGQPAYYPLPFDEARTMWRALDALIVSQGDAGFTEKNQAPKRPSTLSFLSSNKIVDGVLDVSLVSMSYGPQSSSVGTTTSADIGIPLHILRSDDLSVALRQKVRDAARATAESATAVGAFAGQLDLAAGGDYAFSADAADRLYTVLEPKFIGWLRSVGTRDAESHAAEWQHTVKANALLIADELVRGAGPRALIGRITGGEGGRLVNAGSLHQQLKRKLAEILPLTTAPAPVSQDTA